MTRPNWPSGDKRTVEPEFEPNGEFELDEGPDQSREELREDLEELFDEDEE